MTISIGIGMNISDYSKILKLEYEINLLKSQVFGCPIVDGVLTQEDARKLRNFLTRILKKENRKTKNETI